MFHLFDYLAKFRVASGVATRCDDFVDRLNRKYTICILLLCTAIISSKQYVGDPLSCFCPSHFTGAHVEYTNNICWISNVYYVPIHPKFSTPPDHAEDLTSEKDVSTFGTQVQVVKVNNIIAYYPFILLVQALFFYFPYFFWKNIVSRSAYDISTLVNLAKESQLNDMNRVDTCERIIRYILRHIDRASDYYLSRDELNGNFKQKRQHSHVYANSSSSHASPKPQKLMKCKNIFYNFFSNFLIRDCTCSKFLFLIYLFMKILYILNSVGQLLVLNRLITSDELSLETIKNVDNYAEMVKQNEDDYFHLVKTNLWLGFEFGYKSLTNLMQTGSPFSGKSRLLIFQSVIFCDFKIRSLGDRIHKHHVQCVAPILLFSEKIFTFLWFWLFLLSLINICNLIDWLMFFSFSSYRLSFFRKYFHSSSSSSSPTQLFNNKKSSTTRNKLKQQSKIDVTHQEGDEHDEQDKQKSNGDETISKQKQTDFYYYDNDKLLKCVLDTQLELDYVFVLRIITKNVNEILTKEIVTILFENYRHVVNYNEKLK